MNKKRVIIVVLGIIILLAVASVIYFTFFFKYKCADNNLSCFKAYQEKCIRSSVNAETVGLVWKYTILGKEDSKCKISAKVIRVTSGTLDKKVLEGESMTCYLNIGSVSLPDSDINNCHGLLKEELQTLIIKNLHSYVLQNVKEAGSELASIINGTSQ
jgi:hypothetical protein